MCNFVYILYECCVYNRIVIAITGVYWHLHPFPFKYLFFQFDAVDFCFFQTFSFCFQQNYRWTVLPWKKHFLWTLISHRVSKIVRCSQSSAAKIVSKNSLLQLVRKRQQYLGSLMRSFSVVHIWTKGATKTSSIWRFYIKLYARLLRRIKSICTKSTSSLQNPSHEQPRRQNFALEIGSAIASLI